MRLCAFLLSLLSVAFGESICESSACEAADSVVLLQTNGLLHTAHTQSEQEDLEKTEEMESLGENASLQAANCQNAKKCGGTVKCKYVESVSAMGNLLAKNKNCENCKAGSKCATGPPGYGSNAKCSCQDVGWGGAGCKPNQDYHNRGYCRGFSNCWDHDQLKDRKCSDCPMGAVREGWTGDSYPYHCGNNQDLGDDIEDKYRCKCCSPGAMNFPTDGNWGCKQA